MSKKVEIKSERFYDDLFRLSEIVYKLRHYTKKWQNEYGSESKIQKERWERNADKWVEDHVKVVENNP